MSSIATVIPRASRRPVALAVEDDAFERLRLAALLERLGFEVMVAADGAEALAHLAAGCPDVLVTDWQLPAVSGLDLCRTLQSADPAQRPYTVLVTARDEVQDLVAGLDAGADDFLSKPYRAEELSARLRSGQRLLELRRSLVERTSLLEQALRHQGRSRLALDAELAAAARLQHQLLERAIAPIEGLAAAHLFRPARQIGGDVFGTLVLDGGRVGFFHIDATGHGIGAALHAFAIATALLGLGGRAAELEDPATWVTGFNERALDIGAELGCSLTVGWLDLRHRGGRLCQAGHPHPLVVRRDGTVRRLGSGGLPVGALSGARYATTDFQLEHGERFVLHSDGVTDCVNEAGQPFGQERLEAALASGAAHGLAECLRSVSLALDGWRGTATHDDDVSLLMLEPGAAA
jgi:sigma-B regulation protein RsbU (phosphoserine phosphatase)